jgi:hypothetical protein
MKKMTTATKHTPGPWWVIKKENGTLGIGAKEPDGEECRPAQINGTAVDEPWASVTWANARLIAAAPELLSALKDLLNATETDDDPWVHTLEALDAAREAIAKATA